MNRDEIDADEIDPDALEAFHEWLQEPLDLGFPDGYRPGEF